MKFLEDFIASKSNQKDGKEKGLDSVPALLQKNYALMHDLDVSLRGVQLQNEQRCEQEIETTIRRIKSDNMTSDGSLVRFSDDALDEQKHCIRIADEKVALATQAYDMVDAHIQQLDKYMRKLEVLRQEKELANAAAGTSNLSAAMRPGRTTESRGGRKKSKLATEPAAINLELPVDPNEPTYCSCKQVSYGEMVACDNPDCKIEWFHFGCVGLKDQPKGKWYCSDCAGMKKRRKGK